MPSPVERAGRNGYPLLRPVSPAPRYSLGNRSIWRLTRAPSDRPPGKKSGCTGFHWYKGTHAGEPHRWHSRRSGCCRQSRRSEVDHGKLRHDRLAESIRTQSERKQQRTEAGAIHGCNILITRPVASIVSARPSSGHASLRTLVHRALVAYLQQYGGRRPKFSPRSSPGGSERLV